MTKVVVHIDRLVLSGIGSANADAVGAALRGELSRALSDPGARRQLASLGPVATVRPGRITHTPTRHAEPRQLGIAAGRAVTKGIVR